MITKELDQLRRDNNFEHFYVKISSFAPSLKDFIARKLKIAENLGIIEKKFYKANDILDEVYLEVFESFNNKIEKKDLRRMLFEKSMEKLDEKTIFAYQFDNDISIDELLKEELQTMNERYTVDGDGDFILYDELDDISYHQNDFKPKFSILDQSLEKQLTEKLDLEGDLLATDKRRSLFSGLFYNLPPTSKSILELYVFGNQSVKEISEILTIDEKIIEEVVVTIKEKFNMVL